jgi:translation elongation factor EF-G
MDIDFDNLTDEAKKALKDNLEKIESATGVIAFDPSKPLSRSDMEQLKISHKMDGKIEDMTVWDATQMASKGVAYDKHQRTNSENAKVRAAMKAFREMESIDDLPDDSTLELVAAEMGTSKETLVASVKNMYAPQAKPAASANGQSAAWAATIDFSSPEAQAAMKAFIDKNYGDKLVKNPYGNNFLNEQMKVQAEAKLKEEIGKAITADPRYAKLVKEAGDNEQRKGVLDIVTKMLTSTVDKQARGRITEIAAAGEGDILEEIPGLVQELVEITNPSELLSKVTPQAMTFAGSEPGDAAITILSNDKPEVVSMADENLYEENLAKQIGQRLATAQMAGA